MARTSLLSLADPRLVHTVAAVIAPDEVTRPDEAVVVLTATDLVARAPEATSEARAVAVVALLGVEEEPRLAMLKASAYVIANLSGG